LTIYFAFISSKTVLETAYFVILSPHRTKIGLISKSAPLTERIGTYHLAPGTRVGGRISAGRS